MRFRGRNNGLKRRFQERHQVPAASYVGEHRFRPQVERLEERCLLAAGDLDPTFGMGGLATASFQGTILSEAEATAQQPDGKIVLVGRATNGVTSAFAVARYSANGILDPTFGSGGTVTTMFRSNDSIYEMATSVVVQEDGRIIVAGTVGAAAQEKDFALARYNMDGSLDVSFGSSGLVTSHFGNDALLTSLALEPDGKIIAAGRAGAGSVIARYNADGSLDTSFGNSGTVMGAYGTVNALAFESGSKILAVISPSPTNAFLLARYNPDGTPDFSFGNAGQVTTKFALQSTDVADALAIQPDGKIVVGGETSANPTPPPYNFVSALVRYNSDGTVDVSFGSGGKVTSLPGTIRFLVVQSDGNIIVAGGSATELDTSISRLARFTPNGQLDTAFGSQGQVVRTFAIMPQVIALQRDDQILVPDWGTVNPADSFALSRFTSTGNLDATFGTAGQVVTTFLGTVASFPGNALIQRDGRIIVVGGGSGFSMARFNADGSLDATFGTAGKVTTPIIGLGPSPVGVLQPDGKILVAANSRQANGIEFVALARYDADGHPDQTFGTGRVIVTNLFGSLAAFPGVPIVSLPDGKIVVAGFQESPSNKVSVVLERFNNDGGLDASFQANMPPPLLDTDSANTLLELAVQEDGKLLLDAGVSGWSGGNSLLVRFNPSGDLDPTFGTGGIRTTTFAGRVTVQGDGRILVVGNYGAVGLARFWPNGNPDTTFGIAGKLVPSFGPNAGSLFDLVVQPDGKIVLGGRAAGGLFAVERLDPNGSIDVSFGMSGITTASTASSLSDVSEMTRIALQPNGRIVEVGVVEASGLPPQFGIARFLGDTPISDANQRFVTHLYLDLLERSPDASGLMRYTTALGQGQITRMQLVQVLTSSPEYHALEVQGRYGRLLGRPADASGLQSWAMFLDQGGTVEQLETLFVGSAEYYSHRGGGAANGFLQMVYTDVLRRPIDPSGAQVWNQALANSLTPASVASAILASPEAEQITVQDLYRQILHRAADSSGLSTYTRALQQGLTDEQLLTILAASDEYFAPV